MRPPAATVGTPAHAPIGHNSGPPLDGHAAGRQPWFTPTLTEIRYTDELRRLYDAEMGKSVIGTDGEIVPVTDEDLTIPAFLRRGHPNCSLN